MPKTLFTAEWFPYYFERFENSDRVATMTLAEEGAYHRAIRIAWKKGSIPADPKILAKRIGKRCSSAIAKKVLEMFVPMPVSEVNLQSSAKMIHLTVEEIRKEQYGKYLVRRKGGIATATKRWGYAEEEDSSATSSAIAQQPLSYKPENSSAIAIREKREEESIKTVDNSYIRTDGESEGKGNKLEKKSPLPSNFRPTPDSILWAKENCPHVSVEQTLEEFISYWRDEAMKNNRKTIRGWNQAWKRRMSFHEEHRQGAANHGTRNNERPTNVDRIQESGRLVAQYPTEAELALARENEGHAQRLE